MVWIPAPPIEATIALSILFLATELARRGAARPRAREDLAARFPWVVAFTFGLLHGFGFAGALAEVGLPEPAIALALLFFNLGVEAGQLAFVGACLAAAALAARWALHAAPLARAAAVYVIGCVSAFWVLERSLTAL